jgi:hypothetical protein
MRRYLHNTNHRAVSIAQIMSTGGSKAWLQMAKHLAVLDNLLTRLGCESQFNATMC